MLKLLRLILCISLAGGLVVLCGCGANDGTDTASSESGDTSVTALESNDSESGSTSSESTVSEGPTPEQVELRQYLGGWENHITKVNGLIGNNFAFAVQTDNHMSDIEGDRKSGYNVAALSHFVNLQCTVNLGDIIRGYSVIDVDSTDQMLAAMDEIVTRNLKAKCPVLMTIGNHDANHMWCRKNADASKLITEIDHYNRVIARIKDHNGDAMVLDGESTYYYVDFPEYKIRFIMLNTTNGKFTEGYSSTFIISPEQLEWFKTKALNTDYSVIVGSHTPFYCTEEGNNAITNGNAVMAAVEDFAKDGGDFVAYFAGHMHARGNDVDENGRLHLRFLNGGNVGETVIVDTGNRKITIVTMGNGVEREFNY